MLLCIKIETRGLSYIMEIFHPGTDIVVVKRSRLFVVIQSTVFLYPVATSTFYLVSELSGVQVKRETVTHCYVESDCTGDSCLAIAQTALTQGNIIEVASAIRK